MEVFLNRPSLLLTMQLAAFWPVWHWYAVRALDASDDAWGPAALVTALLFAWHNKSEDKVKIGTALLLPALLILIYALSYSFLSPLPRAIIAITSLAMTISVLRWGKSLHLGFCGLLLLSLPLLASLQFYLGFPLRVLTAQLAAPLLQLGSFTVAREGTCLSWNGKLILIDAPCSGVKMLWTGLYLVCALACYYRLDARRTVVATVLALALIIVGNTFRAVGLFYIEAGVLTLPAWAHEGLGVAIFLLTAAGIARVMNWLNRNERVELCVLLAPS